MKKHFILSMAAVALLGLGACDDKTSKEEIVEKSTVNGTTVESTSTTETTVHDDGTVSRESESKTTVDPEGMMNKETTEESTTKEEVR
jgi:hypothetical protein